MVGHDSVRSTQTGVSKVVLPVRRPGKKQDEEALDLLSACQRNQPGWSAWNWTSSVQTGGCSEGKRRGLDGCLWQEAEEGKIDCPVQMGRALTFASP